MVPKPVHLVKVPHVYGRPPTGIFYWTGRPSLYITCYRVTACAFPTQGRLFRTARSAKVADEGRCRLGIAALVWGFFFDVVVPHATWQDPGYVCALDLSRVSWSTVSAVKAALSFKDPVFQVAFKTSVCPVPRQANGVDSQLSVEGRASGPGRGPCGGCFGSPAQIKPVAVWVLGAPWPLKARDSGQADGSDRADGYGSARCSAMQVGIESKLGLNELCVRLRELATHCLPTYWYASNAMLLAPGTGGWLRT